MFQVIRFSSASLACSDINLLGFTERIFLIFDRAANSNKPGILSIGVLGRANALNGTCVKFLSDKPQLRRSGCPSYYKSNVNFYYGMLMR